MFLRTSSAAVTGSDRPGRVSSRAPSGWTAWTVQVIRLATPRRLSFSRVTTRSPAPILPVIPRGGQGGGPAVRAVGRVAGHGQAPVDELVVAAAPGDTTGAGSARSQ